VLLGEKCRGDLSVGLRHGVPVDHATHVTSVAWHLLSTNHMSRACHPVSRPFALRAINILIHFGTRRQVNLPHHALSEGNATHVLLIAARRVNLTIDRAGCLAKKVVLQWHVASIPWQVLSSPQARLLRLVLR